MKAARRTADKFQSQLLQSQKLEAIGTLARGIAHDFNNLLGVIQGSLELARERLRSGESPEEELQLALATSGRAARLTRRILNFSSPGEASDEVVDLRGLLAGVAELERASLPASIELIVEHGEEPRGTRGDATSLEQVLLNLITNAAQALGDRGGRIRLALEVPQGPGGADGEDPSEVTLIIEDDGPGIPPEILPRIFDPFFTTKPPGQGTGLGLSVVHGIVEAHEGHLEVDSEPGRGTTFRITLPAAPLGEPAPVTSAPVRETGTGRILLVEDEDDLRRLIDIFLTRAGYQVRPYGSSSDALEAFRKEPAWPDLVVTDFSMAGLDGRELAEKIKGMRPGLPILLQTGFGPSLETSGADTPYARRLSKPVRRERLLETVAEMLAG